MPATPSHEWSGSPAISNRKPRIVAGSVVRVGRTCVLGGGEGGLVDGVEEGVELFGVGVRVVGGELFAEFGEERVEITSLRGGGGEGFDTSRVCEAG